MKTKVNINHRFLMFLLVMGSVFSMIVSSAFTPSPAGVATLGQSGSAGAAALSSMNSPSLHTENLVTVGVGTILANDGDNDKDDHHTNKTENDEDTNTTNSVTEVSGVVSNLSIGPTLTSFIVAGVGVRMPSSLIQEWTIANGDNVTVEGYHLGPNNTGTFLVTEMDKAQ